MRVNADNILRRVEEILAADGGARVIHDFLDRLGGEMEIMRVDERGLIDELTHSLSQSLGRAVPDVVAAPDGPESLRDRLRLAGLIEPANRPPEDAEKIWERLSPKLSTIREKIGATDELIDEIVERMYGIPRTPD